MEFYVYSRYSSASCHDGTASEAVGGTFVEHGWAAAGSKILSIRVEGTEADQRKFRG
jgi:hypothetical protein